MMQKKEYVNMSKTQAKDLSLVIARMQSSADHVEKNILRTEQLLRADTEREQKKQPFAHQKENAAALAEAEELLKELFMDADRAKKLQHPQGREIEKDVKNLHGRWVKDCALYRELYGQVQDVDARPKIVWAPLFDDKTRQLKAAGYGPTLADVEKQIAAHNILHQEISAYSEQLRPSTTQEQYDALKPKYAELLEASSQQGALLSSLYDYMQSCSKELLYLSGQQDRILQRDWSDRMVDPAGVRMEYEKFKTSGLIAHEKEVNQLEADGQRLVEEGHPGSPTVRAHKEAVQAEWQAFLNLCLAQEAHLDNIDTYKKFQLEAEQLSQSLDRLRSTMDPRNMAAKSNSEALLALEGDEPAVRRNEQRLAALGDLSGKVAPLRARRTKPSGRTAVTALCDWADDNDGVLRNETLTLKSLASDDQRWELEDAVGKVRLLPGACFIIPPPDSEALERVDSLDNDLTNLKRSRAALMTSLKSSSLEAVRPQKAATVQSAPEDPRAAALSGELDRINRALDGCQQEVQNRLRTPLGNENPTADLADRLQDHEKSALAVRKLEAEKASVQREAEPMLTKKPLGAAAAALPAKLSTANNKIHDLNALLDLYNQKATASMFLEKQMRNVDGIVSGFEERLADDGTILDPPNSLQSRNRTLQDLRKDVVSRKGELTKLGKDLSVTQQASRSLQQSFNHFCPDVRRQENRVKSLNNRYNAVSQQLQDRSELVKNATNKNQDFKNAVQPLEFFLVNLPNNAIQPSDGVAQITAKEDAQRRVVADIRRKSEDVSRVSSLSRELQSVLNEYERKSGAYRGTLNDDDDDGEDDDEAAPPSLKRQPAPLAKAVQTKEKDLLNLYAEVSAQNELLLSQLGTARSIMARNEDRASQVVVSQRLQLQSQQKDMKEAGTLKTELDEEIGRRIHAERDLETFQRRLMSLKGRKGVERMEEKEVVQYYRDPKLEVELKSLRSRIQEETGKRTRVHSEMEILQETIIKLELQLSRVEPKLVTKVFTEYERDPQLDKEAERMREEMQRIRLNLQSRDTETIQVRSEYSLLSHQKQKVKETVIKKEVVKVEKDPEMLKATFTFKTDITDGETQCETLNDSIFRTRKEINTLERIIPTIQPKIVSKMVKQVQQDPALIEESKKLRVALEEERNENNTLLKELTTLQRRYSEVDIIKQRVDIKEVINEIYRIDPQTEVELGHLKKELQELGRSRAGLETEINTVMSTLTSLRAQKPKTEYKEVTQEVVKEEKSPEIVRELQRLNNQVSRLQLNYDTTLELLIHLRKERDDLKAEKTKVETKLVTKELIKYEDDPLLEKEADRFRRDVREEIQQRRSLEECLFDLQNQYITLERQRPEEKIVTQEVVRLQKDPKQIMEHDKLNRSLDEEVKSRRKLELEVRQLRILIQEKESTLAQMDDRQKKIQIESELRQVKNRILELETTPTPVEEKIVIEEVLKVERDPELDKLTDALRKNYETESTDISRLEREIRNLKVKLEILVKEKSTEKVVYREVVHVEKDPAVEAEREHLRELVTQERNLRRDLEDKLQNINLKITHLMTSKSVSSKEEFTLISNRDALQHERDDLLKKLAMLETQRQSISVTFQQQTRLVSERSELSRQRSLKVSSEIQRLEQEILKEKDKLHQRETLILELLSSAKEEHSETQTRETNRTTRITILDPDTGKPMSPYEAYVQEYIDREQYIKLSELESDWEEISSSGPDGDTTILEDRKSGKQFSVRDAMRAGRLTQLDFMRYKEGRMPISEFALLVAGEVNKPLMPPVVPRSPTKFPPLTPRSPTRGVPPSPLSSMPSPLRSSFPSLNSPLSSSMKSPFSTSLNNLSGSGADESFPISGVFDTTTQSRMSVRSALTRKLIDPDTALKLLEAQAASGGIVDLNKKDKFSVHKAAELGLIDNGHMYKLLNAQKAFTGVEDPVTKERLAVGQAAQKGYIPQDKAVRYMEAQYLTGGLVDPTRAGRLTVKEALATRLIDATTAKELEDESTYPKEIVDPLTGDKLSYKQALDRCSRDPSTGLLLLPAASTDLATAPSYSNYRFNSPYKI